MPKAKNEITMEAVIALRNTLNGDTVRLVFAATSSTDVLRYVSDAIVKEAYERARQQKKYGDPTMATVLTREGVEAVDEAIAFLMTIEPAPALSPSQGMSDAAADHVRDQGPEGKTGHGGSDGSRPAQRVARHGSWDIIVAENLSYGPDVARHVVMGLIIDDGVPDRGHRTTIFNGALNVIGVSCGPHLTFGTMCTMDYAGEFTEQASSDDVTPQGARSEK